MIFAICKQVTNASNNKRAGAPNWDGRNRNTPSMNALLSVPQTSKDPFIFLSARVLAPTIPTDTPTGR
uniref:Host cell division inhibitor Icd-like protein n=1 Tax=Ascaris lumbricoides TaxID=6252 RepID=A0A0M3I8N4_ASCLU